MTLEQRRSWIFLGTTLTSYVVYVLYVVRTANGVALVDTAYQKPLLISIGAAIAGFILIEILLAVVAPIDTRSDVRDKEIGRQGDYVGYSFVVIGAIAAMLMAMADWDGFWIANVIYLCFAISGLIAAMAKLGMYAKGMP